MINYVVITPLNLQITISDNITVTELGLFEMPDVCNFLSGLNGQCVRMCVCIEKTCNNWKEQDILSLLEKIEIS